MMPKASQNNFKVKNNYIATIRCDYSLIFLCLVLLVGLRGAGAYVFGWWEEARVLC